MKTPGAGAVVLEESDDFVPELEAELLNALRSSLEQVTNASIVLSAREQDGTVVGGLRFCRNLGFEVFGELSNPPNGPLAGHRHFFMRKSI